ncbi:MAG: hypothetical protein KDA85_18300 [Planctomycetaceae bacterium]|nr:hypothetical protein [Planctomycetaceae bacterium]
MHHGLSTSQAACGRLLPRTAAHSQCARTNRNPPTRSPGRAGLTLIESAVSVVLVGLLIIGAMQTLGMALKTRHAGRQRMQASFLAEQLLDEVSRQPWLDPDGTTVAGHLGRESDDPLNPESRSQLDDMDDLHQWMESPCRDASGTVLPGTDGLQRTVTVENISGTVTNGVTAVTAETGLRRITVTVRIAGESAATASVLVSRADVERLADCYESIQVPF